MAEQEKCIFCDRANVGEIIVENDHAFAIMDAFPVTKLHSLIIPKRHFSDYFELNQHEVLACDALLKQVKAIILEKDRLVQGFNIGVNSGEVAGQTIFHCHVHLIPRRSNDVSRPEGGIRYVIPGKGYYQGS